jgi:NADPH:quinone reductase-like Zn-dependent oxidoreductase
MERACRRTYYSKKEITGMKAVRIHNYGDSDVLTHEDIDRPEPTPDEVLVRVRAASASPVDWKMRQGYLREWVDVPMPTILGRDFAGDVAGVGANVTGFAVGDPVFGSVGELHRGAYADYITVSPNEVAAKPASLDYESAAAVPHSGLAAWQALVEAGGLGPGQTVLVHGAAGGVGSLAVQIAKAHGARVIGTASSSNLQFLRDLGVDEAIDYNATKFEDVVSDVDIVLDTIGSDTQERSWQVLKPGGVMATLIGFSPASMEAAAAHGVRAEMIAQRADADHLRSMADLIDSGRIKPVVNSVLPLSRIREAQDRVQTGHTRGKIIMKMDADNN